MTIENNTFKGKGKNIRRCFVDKKMDFKYPNTLEDFEDLLEFFQRRKAPCNENYLGENIN